MAHSNQMREFLLTDRGIELADVYVGPQGVLTGSARSAQEAKELFESAARQEDLQQRQANLNRERGAVEARVAVLWREFEDESAAVTRLLSQGAAGREEGVEQRLEQGRLRNSDDPESGDDAEPAEQLEVAR
jgi:circadian clock protein KaiC